MDVGQAVVTVAFAFLAASFTARNSDLWLHLATGRLIAAGGFTFGVDPFAYTTEGVYWADHAWVFDLLLYQLFQALGGPALVVAKAAAVAATAGVMLRTAHRPPGAFWVAAACILVAVLAMSPRLLLQPACRSLLLLADRVEYDVPDSENRFIVPTQMDWPDISLARSCGLTRTCTVRMGCGC